MASWRQDEAGPEDTIFALSTVPGRSGVAVVRLSGGAAGRALRALTGGALPAPRQASLRRLSDPATGAPIDKGLVLWFPGPKSFTGEDMAELHLHGGRAVRAAALQALGSIGGCRPAEPGEFTRRAFDNGKLDLAEVEGLADLIDAETEAQRRQALRQASGGLSRQVEDWRAGLVAALAHVEAAIDFADEDLPTDLLAGARQDAVAVAEEIARVLSDSRGAERLREGFQVVILGPPNAGKSSLLNSLARRDVAIVSSHAGTTRDVVELHLELRGLPITLADTAGLRDQHCGSGDSQAPIEAEGMRRSRARAEAADLRLLVLDGADWQQGDALLAEFGGRHSQVVINKMDLLSDRAREDLESALACACSPGGSGAARDGPLFLSARTGQGMEDLVEAVAQAAERELSHSGDALVTRLRQRKALEDCMLCLRRAGAAQAAELAAEDLRLALRALGRLVGRVDVEEILEVIFRDFCIGK